MQSIFLDIIKIPIESFKHPFKAVSISRNGQDSKGGVYGIFGVGENKNRDKEYIRSLELQVQNLQTKLDAKNGIQLSATFNGIVIFLCTLTLISFLGAGVAAGLFPDPPSQAQSTFTNICSESAKLLPTALISLLGGKAIR